MMSSKLPAPVEWAGWKAGPIRGRGQTDAGWAWEVRYRLDDGRRRNRSLGRHRTRAAAQAALRALAESGTLTTATPAPTVQMITTVRDLGRAWLVDQRRRAAAGEIMPGTIDNSRYNLKRLGAQVLDLRLDALTREVLLAWLADTSYASSSQESSLASLRAAWNYGARQGWTPTAPEWPRVHVEIDEGHIPTEAEVIAALAELERRGSEAWLPVLLAWETGCRISELLELTWDRIDLVRRRARVVGKRRARWVPLSARAVALLDARSRDRPPVASISRTAVWSVLVRSLAALDAPRWSPHALRHAASMQLYRELGLVAGRILGHSPQVAYKHYTQATEADLDAARSLRSLPRGEVIEGPWKQGGEG